MRIREVIDRIADAFRGTGEDEAERETELDYTAPATHETPGDPATQVLGQQGFFPLSRVPNTGDTTQAENRDIVLPASEDPHGNPAGEYFGPPMPPEARSEAGDTANPAVPDLAPEPAEADQRRDATDRKPPYP